MNRRLVPSLFPAVVCSAVLGFSAVGAGCASAPPVTQRARPADVPCVEPKPIAAETPPPAPLPSAQQTSPSGSDVGDGDPGLAEIASDGASSALPLVACTAFRGRAVRRSVLKNTLDAGLGSWLSGVDIEPAVDGRGRFQGWLINAIHPGDPCWTDVDLRAGDIVARINRRPIQRPEDAQAVWKALRGTNEIVVEYLREGKPKTLRLPVVDDRD